MTDSTLLIESGLRTIEIEAQAAAALSSRIDESFARACQLILACKGRVIVTGMGKSGHIGGKLAATLASTGTPAFFVHPGEASHGDFGMITDDDVIIAISYSGAAQEILTLLPLLSSRRIPIISLTGKPQSTLAIAAEVNLNVGVEKEACPLDLAPTASTTATLIMSDALAVALLEARGFSKKDFAFSHPGGTLGKRLLLTVKDIMHTDLRLPKVNSSASLPDALVEMTEKGLGITTIVNDNGDLAGVFTDGDLRRVIDARGELSSLAISDVMHSEPTTVDADTLAIDALGLMELKAITALVIVDQHKPVGIVHLHDLLRSGIV